MIADGRSCVRSARALDSPHLSRRAFGFAGSVFFCGETASGDAPSLQRLRRAPVPRLRWSSLAARALTILVPAALLVALGWADGGYHPRAWGALLVAAGVVLAAAALLGGEVELDRRRAVFAGGLVALAAWSLVSRGWALAPDGAVLEAERTLAYAGLAGAALLAVPRRRLDELLVGVLAGVGVVSAGGLVRHALGAAAVERLELPIGYANAAGIVACVAILLGLGLCTEGPAARRALGAAVCPPAAVVLLLSLSRGGRAQGGTERAARGRAFGAQAEPEEDRDARDDARGVRIADRELEPLHGGRPQRVPDEPPALTTPVPARTPTRSSSSRRRGTASSAAPPSPA